ncbi:MAG: hypothetical protein KatS3mg125_1400 [Lysobacterales bacterium]|jgi:phage host-nuclease inhibitor protein Gam|nr:MAG: hypothetical protein KatS3mg125_1400 [Xanthomonadales bacterium]
MTTTIESIETIEKAAQSYRQARDRLREAVARTNAAIEAVRNEHLPTLRELLRAVAEAESRVREAVESSPREIWRTKTMTIHGIRVGWQKQRGKVEWDDEAKVIERIRKLLPPEQAVLLIRVRESVHKPAVYDLTAYDLKRLGIRISDDCDVVVVKDLSSELDRALEQVFSLIRDGDES